MKNAIFDAEKDKTSLSLSKQYITDGLKILVKFYIKYNLLKKKSSMFSKKAEIIGKNCGICGRNDS